MLNQNRQPIALISIHGDPGSIIGREGAGGQNVYVRQVGQELASLGWKVDMFTRQSDSKDHKIIQHSPHCRTIRLKAGPRCFIPRDELFSHIPEFLNSFLNWQNQEKITYPLIHTNYWLSACFGLELQKHNKINIVHTYHSLGAVKYNSLELCPPIAKTRLRIEKEILEKSDYVVATSPQEREDLRNLVSLQGNIKLIPCGTDTEKFHFFSRSQARLKLGFLKSDKIVLYVGRLDSRKGIETLVRSCAKLLPEYAKQLKLIIVGGSSTDRVDGAEKTKIETIVKEVNMKQQTIFAGQIGHDLLPLYYCAADVCVIPSHYEPFGLVALESMACGTPVVASDVGGLKFTILNEETGLLVPSKNIDAFTGAIKRILDDRILAKKIKEKASININQNFSWKLVSLQLSDLYRTLLEQSHSQETITYRPKLHHIQDTLTLVSNKKSNLKNNYYV